MLSWIFDSTPKTQDFFLLCQLRSTLFSLRSRTNAQFSSKCFLTLLITVFTLWLVILLLCSGDIHSNPGSSSIDTHHYFFHCRFYHGPRNTRLNACTTYQNPSLSLLLFGSSTLSLKANLAILKQVHKYILNTTRFTLSSITYFKVIYKYISGFQPSGRFVVSTLIPHPIPLPQHKYYS